MPQLEKSKHGEIVMSFEMPKYIHPDFTEDRFLNAPDVQIECTSTDGVAPKNYHSTSMYPEYFKIDGQWILAEESRMDSCVVMKDSGTLAVVEARNLRKGDKVILGRTEKCEEGIYLHPNGFVEEKADLEDQFRLLTNPPEMAGLSHIKRK